MKPKTDSQTQRTNLSLPKGGGGREAKEWKFGIGEANYFIQDG